MHDSISLKATAMSRPSHWDDWWSPQLIVACVGWVQSWQCVLRFGKMLSIEVC